MNIASKIVVGFFLSNLLTSGALAATVFFDDFEGDTLNESAWQLPIGEGTFFGRTQIKPPYFGGDLRPVVSGGVVTLSLDTYNASAITPGDSFWGHEIQTRQKFSVGAGVSVKSRIRVVDTPPGGIVGGFFTYNLKSGPVRDEIDFELLTNDIGSEKVLTNVFKDDNFDQPGVVKHLSIPALEIRDWNEYEIRWFSDRVQWHVNGALIRKEFAVVPVEPQEVRINIWAPDESFALAYDPKLQPVSTSDQNQTYKLEIDYVRVSNVSVPRVSVGLGAGGHGWLEILDGSSSYANEAWLQVNWTDYNENVGETRPAWCDLDGDGEYELVVGLGSGGGGWLEILDEADENFDHLAWVQVTWPSYNAANGETYPACGDVDGDGRDEIVVGLGEGGSGWLQVFDDATVDYAPLSDTPVAGGWLRLAWDSYNNSSAGGATHPAVGNLDADGAEEIVLGLDSGGGGWTQVLDDGLAGFTPLASVPIAGGWLRLRWSAYNVANGATWPAVCDLDGDKSGEIVMGVDEGGQGWIQVFDSASGFNPATGTPVSGGWARVDWSSYNESVGVTYPTCGELDFDGKDELIIGLGKGAGGWLEVLDDLDAGLTHIAWPRVHWGSYNDTNGLSRTAIAR